MELNLTKVREYIWETCQWDTANEYGERGYGDSNTSLVVLGDYWLRTGGHGVNKDTHPERGRQPRVYSAGTSHESTMRGMDERYPRLWAQLESQGVEFCWHDEWVIDDDASKAYRTSGDCYGWEPSTVYTEYGLLTPDNDIETWVEWAVNETTRALTSAMVGSGVRSALIDAGFEQFERDDPHEYASGWHPGQNDTPDAVVTDVRAMYGDSVDIVFAITDIGQFDIHFAAFTRAKDGQDLTLDPEWVAEHMPELTDMLSVASEWHGGMMSGLYSFASTGRVWSEDHRDQLMSEIDDILRTNPGQPRIDRLHLVNLKNFIFDRDL